MPAKIKSIAIAAGLLLFSLPAAADGPAYSRGKSLKDQPAPPHQCGSGPFAGSYIGASIGAVWSQSEGDVYNAGVPKTEDHDHALVGGGYSGFNWQCDRWVFGIESDFNFGDISSRSTYNLGLGNVGTIESSFNYFGTLRGRIGVAHENMLVYFTGGLAYADVEHTGRIGVLSASDSDWKFGYTVGGGVELNRGHWSMKVEGLYVDLGDTDYRYTQISRDAKWEDSFFVARVGLSFKLGDILSRHHEPLK